MACAPLQRRQSSVLPTPAKPTMPGCLPPLYKRDLYPFFNLGNQASTRSKVAPGLALFAVAQRPKQIIKSYTFVTDPHINHLINSPVAHTYTRPALPLPLWNQIELNRSFPRSWWFVGSQQISSGPHSIQVIESYCVDLACQNHTSRYLRSRGIATTYKISQNHSWLIILPTSCSVDLDPSSTLENWYPDQQAPTTAIVGRCFAFFSVAHRTTRNIN